MIEIERINWDEVNGNVWLRKLHPLMLTQKGLEVLTSTIKKGSARNGKTDPQPYLITYGRDYVVKWIVRCLLVPLAIRDYNEFQRLISECWKEYKGESYKGRNSNDSSASH